MSSTPTSCSLRTDRTNAANSGTSPSLRPAAGSSIRRKRGRVPSALATPSFRSSPCGKKAAGVSAWAASPKTLSSSSALACASRDRAPHPSALTSMFSRTVSRAKEWAAWNVRASPARPLRWGVHPVMSSPSSSTLPAEGKSNPVMMLTRVVLPAPLGPISPTTS